MKTRYEIEVEIHLDKPVASQLRFLDLRLETWGLNISYRDMNDEEGTVLEGGSLELHPPIKKGTFYWVGLFSLEEKESRKDAHKRLLKLIPGQKVITKWRQIDKVWDDYITEEDLINE